MSDEMSKLRQERLAQFLRRSVAAKKVANDSSTQEKRKASFAVKRWWKEREIK